MRSLKRIAYVEDEPDIRAVAELALTVVGGYELSVSSDCEQAIRNITAYGPDLILLDVMMPGMTGPELYEHIKRIPGISETPVIFMTAKAQQHEVDTYKKLGAVGVIPKPFDPMTLSSQVQKLWDRAQAPGD